MVMDEIKHMIFKSSQHIGLIGGIAMWLGLIFTMLKAVGIITWSILWVLSPLWIYAIFKLVLILIVKLWIEN